MSSYENRHAEYELQIVVRVLCVTLAQGVGASKVHAPERAVVTGSLESNSSFRVASWGQLNDVVQALYSAVKELRSALALPSQLNSSVDPGAPPAYLTQPLGSMMDHLSW